MNYLVVKIQDERFFKFVFPKFENKWLKILTNFENFKNKDNEKIKCIIDEINNNTFNSRKLFLDVLRYVYNIRMKYSGGILSFKAEITDIDYLNNLPEIFRDIILYYALESRKRIIYSNFLWNVENNEPAE